MPTLGFGLPLRFSPKPSASPSLTSGPKLIAADGPRKLAKRIEEGDYFGAGVRVLDLLFCDDEVRFAPGVELR